MWNGQIRFWDSALDHPRRWTKPRMIFVNSMSDLFHENVPDEWIDQIFEVMFACRQHKFQILTKRAHRMRRYVMIRLGGTLAAHARHIWLGVSVEDQTRADERIPVLLDTPAAVRWISAEPLIGSLDLNAPLFPDEVDRRGSLIRGAPYTGDAWRKLDWVVIGGESGPRARPFNVEWARTIIDQCKNAGVPCFVKQLGARPVVSGHPETAPLLIFNRKGADPAEWPSDLMVREYPAQ